MSAYCFQFVKDGTCRFGDSCKFPHIINVQTAQQQASSNTSPTSTRGPKKSARKGKKKKNMAKKDALDTFFAQYPSFPYDRNAPSSQEFYRMCDFYAWDREAAERKDAHEGFKTALVLQFNSAYGTDFDDVESWRKVCVALNLEFCTEDLDAMRKTIQNLQVNLVDLVDTWRTGKEVEIFASLEELREYTIENGRFFPRRSAYAGGVLRFLLREITGTYEGYRGGKGKRRGKSQFSGKNHGV